MKKFITAVAAALLIGVDAGAYDFVKDGIFYTILPGDVAQVEVSCEKQGYDVDNYDSPMMRDMPLYYFLEWEGNAYSGDVVVPESVEWEGVAYAVTAIGKAAFHNCKELTSVSLPASVRRIAAGAFAMCSLESLELPEGLEELEEAAFMNASRLAGISLPTNISTIPRSCFSGAGSESGSFTLEGWEHLHNVGLCGMAGTPVSEVTLPDFRDFQLGFRAFFGSGLRKISLPASGMDEYAELEGCPELERVVLPCGAAEMKSVGIVDCPKFAVFETGNPVPPSVTYAWGEQELKATLEVPAGSVDAYKEAEGWKNFARIVPIGSTSVEELPHAPQVSVNGGDIKISGDYASVEVYGISGSRMPLTGLAPGVYIVRVDGRTLKVIAGR